jgi:hypothetical protein
MGPISRDIRQHRRLGQWAAIVVSLVLGGCAQDISVHVRAGDRPPNPDIVTLPPHNALTVSGGIQVDSFQIVLRDIRLQSIPTDAGQPTPDGVVLAPGGHFVELSGSQLAPGALTGLVAGVHIGAKGFYEMDIDLRPVTTGESNADPALAPLLDRTFVIRGLLAGGAPFTFDSTVQQVLIRPAVYRMGLNHNNVDVNIAPARWFDTGDGGVLDPSSSDPAVRSAIEGNVLDSIDGYEDDNLDGLPDPEA